MQKGQNERFALFPQSLTPNTQPLSCFLHRCQLSMPAAVVAADALVHVARDVLGVIILLINMANFDHEIGVLEVTEVDRIASPLVKAVTYHRLGRIYAPIGNA